MNISEVDVAIVGAGPYGLSVAAYLRAKSVEFRIFGKPMQSWREHMPRGMFLKSEGFASSLFDPDSVYPLSQYCAQQRLEYQDVGCPVPIEQFTSYGAAFQEKLVPNLEQVDIAAIRRTPSGYELETTTGDRVQCRRVVVAAGITHFGYLPPVLAGLPENLGTHSSRHSDLSRFKGRVVAVIGGGASAVDVAALLHETGAEVHLIARRAKIAFHDHPPVEPRPLLDRVKAPRSGLGVGWRSRLCTDAPLVFHKMPERFRARVVERHLGPAPGWFMKDKVMGRFPLHLGSQMKAAEPSGTRLRLTFQQKSGNGDSEPRELCVDHVIGATGYRVNLKRFGFLDASLQESIREINGSPVLTSNFECSVPGVYMVGLVSANSFGPLTRFAYGAGFTARRLSRHLAATA